MTGSDSFQTLIVFAIPILTFASFPHCDGIVKRFRKVDDRRQCPCPSDSIDLYYYNCKSSDDSCFRCLLDPSISLPASVVCDNIIDCPDLTDELLCDHVDYTVTTGCGRMDDDMIVEYNQEHLNGTVYCICQIFDSGQFFLSYYDDVKTKTIATHDAKDVTSLRPICECSAPDNSTVLLCYDTSTQKIKYAYSDVQTPQIAIGFIISIVGILGNIAVISMTVRMTYKNYGRLVQEEKLTKYFFLSLALSDMLVAICTLFFCMHLKLLGPAQYSEQDNFWEISYCSANGALAVLGSQQSIFTMVLISMSRIWGVARPFSRTPLKAFVMLLFISWGLAAFIAIIPLMNVFEYTFLKDIVQNQVQLLPIILREDVDDVQSYLRQYSHTSDDLRPSGSLEDLRYLMQELFGINKVYYVGYYQGLFSCLPDIFPRRETVSLWQFNFALFSLNIFCFFFMLVGYIYIYATQGRDRRKSTVVPAEEAETQRMKRKIFYILATNFICWIPLCSFGVGHIIHTTVVNDTCHLSKSAHRTLSLIAILVVVPCNSAVNPFLYSAAPEYLRRQMIEIYRRCKRKWSSSRET